VTVSASAGAVTIGLPDTIVANLTGTAASATFATTAGTANAVAANSVALGTDTTGNYVATITGTENEVEVSGSGSESANITIGLPDNVTLGGNLVVSGNLTVSGSTTYLNTETLTVEDNIVLLNSGVTGVPSTNAGLEIERGDSSNTSLIWNESTDSWSATNDGTNYHALARKYVENVGNSASTVFALTHNLGTRDVTVQVFDNSTYETVEVDIARTSTTVTTVTFAVAPSSNAYRVVITG
jgi:sulfur transfer complex TusBCD TusB component (DsrH family)